MTTWNYRVVTHTHDDETFYTVHEVYYKADGSIDAWSPPVSPHGETLEILRQDIEHMLEGTLKPALDLEDMEREAKA